MNNVNVLNVSYRAYLLIISLLLISALQNPVFASNAAGKTILAKGTVEAVSQDSQEKRKLRRRSEIFEVDTITTGEKSKAQFSMSDGGLITLKENTEILVSNYKYDQAAGEASATLEVVTGGLRSISGLIKKSGGDYQVKTPVGSIGIRGTHFAVNVIEGETFFAVYSGNIDVNLNNQQTLSLGVSENFAFASVNAQGVVTPMTQAPEAISLGFSSNDFEEGNSDNGADDSLNGSSGESSTDSAQFSGLTVENSSDGANDKQQVEDQNVNESELYKESQWQGVSNSPIAELLAVRTGITTYQNVTDSAINSSAGQVSNFAMNMSIDFDNGSVPSGSLSFSDAQGEWFAAYSGLINVDRLDLGINFASHGNQKAQGSIFAGFTNGLDEITGGFNLHEINNPSVTADGSFKIKP
ncbi:hypothetical protein NBRC116592_06540 [Colwellia sp. KU-HH00111]|uniref:FecR family protein n=1 Tax=Colwellia sp. KU-HH00111 TaxID=3127652 RepID=UPI003104E50A